MKIVLLTMMLLISMDAMSQDAEKLSLPKVADIERIEFNNRGDNWYNSAELLKILPRFIASQGTYTTKALPQYHGKFVLKNGQKINWDSIDRNSMLLYRQTKTSRIEQLFVLKSDEPLFIIFDKDGKEGFINSAGKVIIPTKFDEVTEFINDLAAVKFNGKWGFIDRQGNFAVEPKYEGITPFSEGFAAVNLNHKWGFIDSEGNLKIKPKWLDKERFYDSPGFVKNGYKFKNGIATVYEDVRATGESYDFTLFKCGYIDKAGEYLIEPVWRSACGDFQEGLAMTGIDTESPDYKGKSGWIGYIDLKGSWAIPPQFYAGGDFKNGYALVKLPSTNYENELRLFENKDWILIDKKGQKTVGVKTCERQFQFHEGFAQAYSKIDTAKVQHFFINEECEKAIILPNNVSIESDFSEGFALIKDVEGYKFIDTFGKNVFSATFADAKPFADNVAIVRKKGDSKDTYINKQGVEVLKPTSLSVAPFVNGLAYQFIHLWTISERPDSKNIRGYMNKQGKYVWLSPGFEVYLSKEWIRKNYIGTQKVE